MTSCRVGRVHLEGLEVESTHPACVLDCCGFLVLSDTAKVVILCNPPSIHLLGVHTILWMQVLDLTCGRTRKQGKSAKALLRSLLALHLRGALFL